MDRHPRSGPCDARAATRPPSRIRGAVPGLVLGRRCNGCGRQRRRGNAGQGRRRREGGTACPEESFPGGEMASSTETLAARQFPHEDDRPDAASALPSGRDPDAPLASAMSGPRGVGPICAARCALIVRSDGDIFDPILRRRPQVQRKLLVLIDISGLDEAAHRRASSARPRRSCRDADRAEMFTLGTRLTRITAPLRIADCGRALARVAETVEDWDGGTRIGPTLLALLSVPRFAAFARGAAVVILSDGLERAGHAEMETGVPAALGARLPAVALHAAGRRSALPSRDGRAGAPSCHAWTIWSTARRYRPPWQFHPVARAAGKAARDIWREVS